MSDIAEQSSNAIIKPGRQYRLLLVGNSIERLLQGALNPKTFGPGFEFVETGAENCCGAVFISEMYGGIFARQFWQLEYFFVRDGVEAIVFEFDRWQKHFFARRLEEIKNRRKL